MDRTRICSSCQAQKSVNAIWYILPKVAQGDAASFLCEPCYGGYTGRPMLIGLPA